MIHHSDAASGLRSQDLVYMLVVDKPGSCIEKLVPVNRNTIGTPYCTSATASFHSTFKPRQPGEYMIGVI
jgi:hypothetical protein